MRTSIIARLGMLAVLVGCGDVRRAEYATFDAAVAAGAARRGWIPPYVPQTAVDIAEAHDLDLNTQRLRFRAPEGAASPALAGRSPIPGNPIASGQG